MGKKDTNWDRFYQKLNMIFHSVIAITMIPFAWIFLETEKGGGASPILQGNTLTVIQAILIALAAAIIGYSRSFGNRMLIKTHQQESIPDKLKAYLQGKVKYYLLLESGAVLAVLGLYLTKNHLFSLIYVLVLFVFSLGRPSFDKVSRETGIRQNELKNWGEE